MENRLFDGEALAVLLHPERWHVVCSALPAETEPLEHARHRQWMRAHAHAHPHQEVMLLLRGQGLYGLRGQPYACAPGTLFLFDAHEAHDLGFPPWAAPMELLWMALLPGQCVARVTSVHDGVVEDWRHGSLLLTEAEGGGTRLALPEAGSPALARLRLVSAVSLLVSAIVQRGYRDAVEEEPLPQRMVHTVQRYIRETAGRGVTLDMLARISGYSKFHFLRLFRRCTGQTVHRYIDNCRLRRAREMLRHGRAKKEIAHALGFSCPAAFSRWWRAKGAGTGD